MNDRITIMGVWVDATRPGVWEKLHEIGLIWPVVAEVQDALLGWVRNWQQYGDPNKEPEDEGGQGTGPLTGALDLRILTEMARLRGLSEADYGAYDIGAGYADGIGFYVNLTSKVPDTRLHLGSSFPSFEKGNRDRPTIHVQFFGDDSDAQYARCLEALQVTPPTPADATGKRNGVSRDSGDKRIGCVRVTFDCW
jgi:hypothetical protein